MRGKIPQFSYNVEEDLGVGQRDVEAKSKMKTCADTKVNAKKYNIQEGDLVLWRQEKRDNLSPPFETTPYSVVEKKGTMVMAERSRVNDGRTVARNTSDFKGYSVTTEEQTQDHLNVSEEAATYEIEPTKPVCPSLREPGIPVLENDAVSPLTSSPPIAVPTTPGSHSPVTESRLPRRERRKPVRFKDYTLY